MDDLRTRAISAVQDAVWADTDEASRAADAVLAEVRAQLLNDETADAISAVTSAHYIEADRCACDEWADGKDADWDQHMAEVTVRALAERIAPERTGDG